MMYKSLTYFLGGVVLGTFLLMNKMNSMVVSFADPTNCIESKAEQDGANISQAEATILKKKEELQKLSEKVDALKIERRETETSILHQKQDLQPVSQRVAVPKERVAVLTSGQCYRFAYREDSDTVLAFRSSKEKEEQPEVDVYIVLSCGETSVTPFDGSIDAPAYMQTLNLTDIEYWFKEKRGAASVTIKILNETQMQEYDKLIIEHTTQLKMPNRRLSGSYTGPTPSRKSSPLFGALNATKAHDFHGESRKFYGRQLAYEMTRAQGRIQYSAYIYMREDNYFVKPLDLDRVFFNSTHAVSGTKPFVVVDKACTFGAYSDKFYVANKLGADLLFTSTFEEHVERMKRYVLRWHYFHTLGKSKQPGQPEAFTDDILSTAQVQEVFMHRIDVRYVENKLCSKKLYFDCMPRKTQRLAKEKGISSCPLTGMEMTWKAEKDHWDEMTRKERAQRLAKKKAKQAAEEAAKKRQGKKQRTN